MGRMYGFCIEVRVNKPATKQFTKRCLCRVEQLTFKKYGFYSLAHVFGNIVTGTDSSFVRVRYRAPWRLRGVVPRYIEGFRGCSPFGQIERTGLF